MLVAFLLSFGMFGAAIRMYYSRVTEFDPKMDRCQKRDHDFLDWMVISCDFMVAVSESFWHL